jgi:AcrR family transcriptional regulator
VSAPTSPRRDAQRNRQRLVAAARAVYSRRGLSAPLAEIAREADVATATAYRHFPDRTRLIDGVFEEVLLGMIALAQEALEADDPWDGLVRYVLGALELQAADRGVREVIMSSHGESRLAAGRARLLPVVQALFTRAQGAGVLRADVAATDLAILGAMLAFEMDYAGAVAPDLWRRHAELILDGLRARADTPPLPGPPLDADRLAAVQDTWGTRDRTRR